MTTQPLQTQIAGMSMTILGVDPGSRVTGFGVVTFEGSKITHVNHGVIVLDGIESFPLRMHELSLAFSEVMGKYQPQHVVIEKIFLGKNVDSAFKLGHARGVIMAEAGKYAAEVHEYATRSVKKGITGNGGASKEEVQAILKAILKIAVINRIDASDALAMACYHAYEIKKRTVLGRVVEL